MYKDEIREKERGREKDRAAHSRQLLRIIIEASEIQYKKW